jgi:hypothetical protein
MRRVALAIMLCVVSPLFAQSPAYHITRTYALGGDGGWDYIVPEPAQHRLFIGRTNRVMVVDENDGTLLGEVIGIKGARTAPRSRRRAAMDSRRRATIDRSSCST